MQLRLILAIPHNNMQYYTISYDTIQYHAIPYNTMQYHTIPCNTIQYYAIPCNTMPQNTPEENKTEHCPTNLWLKQTINQMQQYK